MSDITDASEQLTLAAKKANETTDFFDDVTTLGDSETVTNPNNGITVPSVQKQIKDLFDDNKVEIDPLTSVSVIPNITGYSIGDRVTWLGYYSELDGGGNWGIVKQGSHTADGGSIFTISGDYYVEASHSGRVDVRTFGAKFDGVTDDTSAIQATIDFSKSVWLPKGDTIVNSTGFELLSDHDIAGAGRALTRILVTPDTDTVVFNVTLTTGAYKTCSISGMAVVSRGSNIGQSVIKTEKNALGLSDKHSFFIEDLFVIGATPWSIYLDIGDHVTGFARDIDLRGYYDTSIIDSGQDEIIGISLDGADGGFGFEIYNFKMSGMRNSIYLGTGIEAFYIRDGEASNSWIGILADQTVSSPGGNVRNVHISANKYPIYIGNRRYFNVSDVQLYRTTGTAFDHDENWAALTVSGCSRASLSGVVVRHENEAKSSENRIGVWITDSQAITLSGAALGGANGLSIGVAIGTSTGIKVSGVEMEAVSDNLINISGTCSKLSIDPVAYNGGVVPEFPVWVGVNSRVPTTKVSRLSSYIPDYEEVSTIASTPDLNLYAGVSAKHLALTDDEPTSAYTLFVNLKNDNVLYGDEFSFMISIPASERATYKINNGLASELLEVSGAGSYSLSFIFGSNGWVLKSSS